MQLAFAAPGRSEAHIFAVSSQSTNDVVIALLDRKTRSGTVWLTSPEGDIRATILTSSNGPPQVVPNEKHVDEFAQEIAAFLGLVEMAAEKTRPGLSGDGEMLGEENADSSGTVREISDRFGRDELRKLYLLLNSPEWQAPFTNYTCGEPAPKLKFSVSLRPSGPATTRAVEISHSPGLSPSGHTRCLMFGVGYMLDKAVAQLDPDPKQEDTRNPHCDCSKRDTKEEWVTHLGPTEILAPKKVAAKEAARKAEAAGEEKGENLATIHLDPTGVQVDSRSGERLETREQLLATLPVGAEPRMLAVDPTFSHCAFVLKKGAKELVVLDGVEGKEYDGIPDHQRLVFSADGKRFAYIAKRGGKMMTVVDGKEGKAYDRIEELFHPRFSPDGKRFAFIASAPALGFPPVNEFAVVDGQEQKRYDLVEGLSFSPDSRHVAYHADRQWNRGTSVVVDGKENKPYDQVVGVQFSPDGNRMAFVGMKRMNRNADPPTMDCAVVDGKEGKMFRSVSDVRFSPDSQHLAYTAGNGSGAKGTLVRDLLETKYGHVELGPFSPDSQHLACVARFGTNWLILIDGKRLDPQQRFDTSEMSWSNIRDLVFSPDGRHLACMSRGPGTTWWAVLDGRPIKGYEWITASPAFSPDGKRMAFAVKQAGKRALVLGGHTSSEYDDLFTLRSDLEDGARTVGFRFDETGVLHAIARRGQETLKIEIEITKP
jgi:Tol biopolymer transport system component